MRKYDGAFSSLDRVYKRWIFEKREKVSFGLFVCLSVLRGWERGAVISYHRWRWFSSCSKSRLWTCMHTISYFYTYFLFFFYKDSTYTHEYLWHDSTPILSSMTTFNTVFASPQNSVRHTLSVRQRFLRLPRMINGIVSHKSWWTLSEEFLKKRTSLELKAFNLLPQSANRNQANQETQTEDLICSRCSRTLLRDWLHCIEVNHLGTQKIIHVHTIFISNYFAFVKSGLRVRLNVTFFLRPNTIYFFTFNSSGGGVGWGGAGGWGIFL